MRPLPTGWVWSNFDEVAKVESNLVDPASYPNSPHVAPNHIQSKTSRLLPYTTIAEDGVTSSKHHFLPGQILYSKIRPYLAKAVLVSFEGLCSADMYPISTTLEPRYLLHWLVSSEFTELASHKQGRSVLPKINQRDLGMLPVPVPPLAEQERIVAAIEEQFSRLDTAEDSLRHALPSLESLRLVVTAQATQGDWPMKPVGEIATVISGPAFQSQHFGGEGSGIPLLRGENIEPGALRWRDVRTWPDSMLDGYEHLYITETDLILAMDRPVISTGLKLAPVRTSDLPALLVQRVARIRPLDGMLTAFLHLALLHHRFVPHLLADQTGTQVPHVTLKGIREFVVPVPPVDEQVRIIAMAEQQLSLVSSMKASVERMLVRGSGLRRAVLQNAFSGRLVRQDPTDEPADALLSRVLTERIAASNGRSGRKRTKAGAT